MTKHEQQPAPPSSDAVLREALREARQYVSDAGIDEDPETVRHSTDLLAKIDAALSSAPSPAAGDAQKQAIEQILDMVLSRGPTPSGTYRERAEAIVAALSSPAAGSDGWQRDAALEEAAKIAEGEYGQNAWKLHMPISDYIAKAIRALKSAAPTQTDGWQRDAALEEAAKIAEMPFLPSGFGGDLMIDAETNKTIATAIRALKSAAPTPSTASDGQ